MSDEYSDLLADCSAQILNVFIITDVRQIAIHASEPLLPGRSLSEAEIAFAKLNKYKSPGSDQIPAELTHAEGKGLLPEIHKLVSIWNKKELSDRWKESLLLPIYKEWGKTNSNNYRGI
jgi:hypothetical protein